MEGRIDTGLDLRLETVDLRRWEAVIEGNMHHRDAEGTKKKRGGTLRTLGLDGTCY